MSASVRLTSQRSLTRRGVLWLGLRCDVRCKFCYDELVAPNQKGWMPLEEATARLTQFRDEYANEYVDFMGGEPTLYPDVLAALRHCASIGLRPTVITHGMRLADYDRAAAYAEAGLHDALISVHGLGDRARAIHGRGHDNHAKQLAAMANLQRLGVPFRFNVTLIRDNVDQLEAIARLAVAQGARVVNFLTFNPYFEWARQPEIPFQVKHSDIAGYLARALDVCTEGGVEANVRYMPICQLPGREHHVYTGFQLPYDQHEWDYNSWYGHCQPAPADATWYLQASREQQARHHYRHAQACAGCALRNVCDGFHEQYLARWGGDEARPYAGEPTSDPTVYISRQQKVEYVPQVGHSGRRRSRPVDESEAKDWTGTPALDGRAGRKRASVRTHDR